MFLDSHWTNAGTATPMGDTESLVKIEVAYISSEIARSSKSYKGIEVGPVHIDLTSCFVNDVAYLSDAFFEHSVGRRVGDHDPGKSFFMLGSLSLKVIDIYVPCIVALDHDHFKSRHNRGRSVSPMC